MEDRLLLTIPEAAARLGISRSLVYMLLRDGSLFSLTIGQRARRIPRQALQDFIDRLAQEQGGAAPSELTDGTGVHLAAPSSTMQHQPGGAPRGKAMDSAAHPPAMAERQHQ